MGTRRRQSPDSALPLTERYGVHRVVSPRGALPQVAEILDADPQRRSGGELLIDVETLNIDSASMRQLEESESDVGAAIERIVRERGKMQNPVTGSGGMLLGRVLSTGSELGARYGVREGDRVATLVSLTLTPLHLRRIVAVRAATHQVDVEGTAVVFPSGSLAPMPDDLPERLALALFDVAGAAPQALRLASPGGSVCVLGAGGKSGLLVGAAARERVGPRGTVVGLEAFAAAATAARAVGSYDAVSVADASDPMAALSAGLDLAPPAVRAAGGFDLVVSCVNASGAELGAILLARPRGRVYFFGMATQFARAALGAEGVSRDVDLYIGNGFCEGHAATTLALVRRSPALRAELERRFL